MGFNEGYITLGEIIVAMLLRNKILLGCAIAFSILLSVFSGSGQNFDKQSLEEIASGLPDKTCEIVTQFVISDRKINRDLELKKRGINKIEP